MALRLFSVFNNHAKPKTQKCSFKSPVGEEHFSMLVSLQLAVGGQAERSKDGESELTAEDMLHGTNEWNLRKQGRLCLTFALKNNIETDPQHRIRLANELESAIDAAYSQEDYRHRIYLVGGCLTNDPTILDKLLRGERSVEEVAVAGAQSLAKYRLKAEIIELPAWC